MEKAREQSESAHHLNGTSRLADIEIGKKRKDSMLMVNLPEDFEYSRASFAKKNRTLEPVAFEPFSLDTDMLHTQQMDSLAEPAAVEANANALAMLDHTQQLTEIDVFETLIVKSLILEQTTILQLLIENNELPDKCKSAQKPRRYFAAKMFETTLSEYFK